ncbi:WxL domain-containing protein [Enterococcus sp. AZ029]|uniref:WxL domain-containing protein n=1 Tax=Enterococcus sp. AZ029 TaxID=2774841 RepID=UPI003F2840AE
MKQTKWQRLATIGLCSSLVINAFSGVTAVAETITIESSPTVASSAKEATSASSATPASTESSQETTETSREEVTQETEKPEVVEEETEAKKQEEETVTSEVVQPNPVLTPTPVSGIGVRAGNLAETYQYFLEIQKKFQINGSQAQVVTPNIAIGVNLTSSEGATVNIDDFELRSTVRTSTSLWDPSYGGYRTSYSTPENISSTKLTNSIQMNIPSKILRAQANATYTVATYSFYLEDVSLSVPKYISNVFVGEPLAIKGIRVGAFAIPTTATLDIKKINQETYKLETNPNTGNAGNVFSTAVSHSLNRSEFGTVLAEKDLELSVVFKKVTESFKDTAGATIPAPTGFTQGKQTSITSNNYTFKQAGTLPETYKASNGKTYKFKGWYKGKTKPNTLTTTKAPSYPVTYDDNDDLNVVYEEAFEFPEETFQFGFVNQDGDLVKPDDIVISYDYASFSLKDNSYAWNTIASNQKATTSGNLKNVVRPSSSVPNPTENGTGNGDHFSNFSISLPKYYTELDVYDKSGKISSEYPLPPHHYYRNNEEVTDFLSDAGLISWMTLSKSTSDTYVTKTSIQYPGNITTTGLMIMRRFIGFSVTEGALAYYHSLDAPFYYHLTQRKVTESFKDTAGATIPAPTGFTQGKQTSITSNNYTFKQAGTLPETYKASNGKTYKFKGWYKGKTKPNTLTTTKAPSYPVTYNDDDDLTVVYEEIEVFDFPALTYQFGFVDESGKRVDASTIDLTYDKWRGEVLTNNVNDWKTVSLEKGQVAPTKNNLKEIVYPSHSLEIMNGRSSQYSAANLTFKIPKYYENISVYNKNGTFDTAYPFPTVKINTSTTPLSNRSQLFQLKKSNNQSFIFNQTTEAAPADVQVPYNLREIVYDPAASINKGLYHMLDKPIYYYLTNRKVTENFVDTNGTKVTPPTGFTQGNQIPMTSNTFKYTAARALPTSYSVGGKTYIFQGWYKGKTKPNTLTTSTTPTYNTTFDGNDDMTAIYKEEVPKASVALTRTTAETVTSGGNVTWRATITNTSQAPLTTATIKKSTAWTTGLAAPTAMIVTPAGGTAKTVPVTTTTWTNGVSLGTDIPVGKSATVQFTTKATGTAGQVLRAGITTSGNYSGVSASATVRVKDNDQAIVTPTAEGFISVPTFNFGQVGVAGSTQQHSLKKAADYYGNGTRNPYLRIKKTQPNWSLTAQLSQPKSATDSLPTATRLLLGAAPVSSFSNYNQPTELKNAVGTTSAISLNANNTATRIIANQQFTGSNIYQLDFTFNNVKLEVPANQGVKGQQYQAAITWNLVTGP